MEWISDKPDDSQQLMLHVCTDGNVGCEEAEERIVDPLFFYSYDHRRSGYRTSKEMQPDQLEQKIIILIGSLREL